MPARVNSSEESSPPLGKEKNAQKTDKKTKEKSNKKKTTKKDKKDKKGKKTQKKKKNDDDDDDGPDADNNPFKDSDDDDDGDDNLFDDLVGLDALVGEDSSEKGQPRKRPATQGRGGSTKKPSKKKEDMPEARSSHDQKFGSQQCRE